VVQWLYNQRDPISWGSTLLMGLSVIGLGLMWPPSLPKTIKQEMMAVLEAAPQPAAPTRPAPAKVLATPIRAVVPTPANPAPLHPTAESAQAAPMAAHAPSAAAAAAPLQPTPSPAPADEAKAVRAAKASTYEALLLAYLERIKRYPTSREARISKPQGVVKLWLVISRQGDLLEAGVANSSGSNLLDSEALRTVRSGRFPTFPDEAFDGESKHRFTVNLKYEIEGQA
jgi:periplasmic protein TonB